MRSPTADDTGTETAGQTWKERFADAGVLERIQLLARRIEVDVTESKYAHLRPIRKLKRFGQRLQGKSSKRSRKVRRFVDPNLTREGLFRELDARNIRYVVLRWFENLPTWPDGEDVDLLVDFDDLDSIDDLFVTDDRSIPCDVYSSRPAKGALWNGLAYYPPKLSERLLQTRVRFGDYCYVPEPKQHALSLAYHAVYHKAENSDIPLSLKDSGDASENDSDHSYRSILSRKFADLGIDVSLSIVDLHQYLQEMDWAPPLDMLRKLSQHRKWLRHLLPTKSNELTGDVVAFVFRKSAHDHGIVESAISFLTQKHRLELIASHDLSESEIENATDSIRGGNWDAGPFPKSGGPPVSVAVFLDLHPDKADATVHAKYPFVSNRRVLLKNKIRRDLNRQLPRSQRCNCVHSSDDELEATEFLQTVVPELSGMVDQKVAEIRASYRTTDPLVRLLGPPGRRAKTELVHFHDQLAVKKTFRSSQKVYCDREKSALRKLRGVNQHVPPVLASDDCCFYLPYIENVLGGMTATEIRKTLRPFASTVMHFLRCVHATNLFLVDFHPRNLLLTPEGDLHFIDFEFAQSYGSQPPEFQNSYDLVGLPDDFQGDRPFNLRGTGYTFENTWSAIFDLPLNVLIEQSATSGLKAA